MAHPPVDRLVLVVLVTSLAACGTAVRPSPLPSPVSRPTPTATSVPGASGVLGCACQSGDPAGSASATASPAPADGPTPSPGPLFRVTDITQLDDKAGEDDNLEVTVIAATFGQLTVQTAPDAQCIATGNYPSGARIATSGLGYGRPGPDGIVRWTFSLVPAEQGTAWFFYTCSSGHSRRSQQVFFPIG